MVEWDLREPFTQEIVTHPSVNIAFDPDAARDPRRGHRPLPAASSPARGKVVATKFRPGGFHPLHPVPAHTLTDRVIPAATSSRPSHAPTTSASRSR